MKTKLTNMFRRKERKNRYAKLNRGQEATVRTVHGTTDWFQIGKGVRQGCYVVTLLI